MKKIQFIRRIVLIHIIFCLSVQISEFNFAQNELHANFSLLNSNSLDDEPTCTFVYPARIKIADVEIVDSTLNSGSYFDIGEDDSLILYAYKIHAYDDPIGAGLLLHISYNGNEIYNGYMDVGSIYIGLSDNLWEFKMPEEDVG